MKKIYILIFLITGYLLGTSQETITLDAKRITPEEVGIYDTDLLPPSFHKNRREALRKLMPDKSVAVFFAGPVRNRSNDVDYEFHQDPNFYYLTGLRESHAVLVVYKEEQLIDGVKTKEVLFLQERNPKGEKWNGRKLGTEGAKQLLLLDHVLPSKSFKKVDLLLDSLEQIFYVSDREDVRNDMGANDLYDLIQAFNQKIAGKKNQTRKKYKLNTWMAQLRQDKLDEELELMRKAIDITCMAQIELMQNLKPDMTEYQTEALVEFRFKYEGAEYTGFPSIHGSGENSCILHYTDSRRPFTKNDLLVSDIGAEYHGYTADVTRTLPVNGKYSKEQKAIYNLVFKAQEAGIQACKPGAGFWDAHGVATDIIGKGLVELGIIKEEKEVRKYFLHGTSHYLGLDVHDMGDYKPLKAGQVITVEPGIYIPEGSECDEKWWNIGVRIEDDILITEDGRENLSDCVPRTIEEIKAIMVK